MSRQQYFQTLSIAFKSFCLERSCMWELPRGEELVTDGGREAKPTGLNDTHIHVLFVYAFPWPFLLGKIIIYSSKTGPNVFFLANTTPV